MLLACGLGSGAWAQDATWKAAPVSNDFATGSNWSTGVVPTGTATFGASTTTTIGVGGLGIPPTGPTLGTLKFDAGAPAYIFNGTLSLTGAGIVNNSSNAPTFDAISLTFKNSAGAGDAKINTRSTFEATTLAFVNSSNAGTATIANQGRTFFTNSASAANSNILNNGGMVIFQDSATAGSASITNTAIAQTQFQNTSTAGTATITTNDRSLTIFKNSSSAGNASIVVANGGLTTFTDGSTAGNATITTNGVTAFGGQASGGQARLIVNAGGQMWARDGTMSIGSIEGAGSFLLSGIASGVELVVGGNGRSTEVSGTIDGAALSSFYPWGGSLVKVGAGTLTLSGASTLASGTRISEGRLVVNGTLASDVAIASGASLGGTGVITGNVVNNGIVSPSSGIGTLSLNGGYTQAAGSTYQVQVNPTQSSLIAVAGGVVLNGGTVSVLAQNGTYAPKSHYTILSATGGITGAYASVTSNLAFLTPVLSYTANTVALTLSQGATAFSDGGLNPNQKSIGRALDAGSVGASGDFKTVLDALSVLDTAQGPRALDAVGGQNYSGFGTAGVQSAQTFMDNFQGQAGGGQFFSGSNAAAPSGGHIALADACDITCDSSSTPRWGAWGGGLGGFGTVAGDANSHGLTYTLGGFAAGLDRRFGSGFMAGFATGFTATTLYTQDMPGRGTSNTLQFALYGEYAEGPFYVDTLAGYARSDNRMSRPISIPGLSFRTAQGQTVADQFFGQVEAGYKISVLPAFGGFATPFARLQGSTSTQAGFTESGADSLNLTVAAQTTNSLRTVLGAQIGASLDAGRRDKLNVLFRLGWSHEFADLNRPVTAAFAGAPAIGFATLGAIAPRDGVVLGLAVNTAVGEATSLYLRYDGDLAGANTNHAITGGVRFVW
jgi:outer membrane autotransporter protein